MKNYGVLYGLIEQQVKAGPLWANMLSCVEGSRWHREENVAVHTEMVLAEFFKRVNIRTLTYDEFKCAIALLFHDVGKPIAKEEKFSEERGVYYRFTGHELKSARLFEDFAVENWDTFVNSIDEWHTQDGSLIYDVVWLIQNHLPYNVLKSGKLMVMRGMVERILPSNPRLFKTMVLSDQYGRISDDHNTNKLQIHEWFDDCFYSASAFRSKNTNWDAKRLKMLIGSPGSGKSTVRDKCLKYTDGDDVVGVYSLDDFRMQTYPTTDATIPYHEQYRYAFEQSIESADFENLAYAHYCNLLDTCNVVLVDNTNISEKRRNKLLEAAKNRDFFTECVIIPVSQKQLYDRCVSREDHKINYGVVINMYNNLTYPQICPLVDRITVSSHNINMVYDIIIGN